MGKFEYRDDLFLGYASRMVGFNSHLRSCLEHSPQKMQNYDAKYVMETALKEEKNLNASTEKFYLKVRRV